jgi:hypothetical protein
MSNRRNIQFTYNPHNKLTLLDCNFVVSQTNANGLGITSLNKSGRIASVYMNTSPATTSTSSVFASGVSVITVASVTGIYAGQTVTDSTTGANISAGTKVVSIRTDLNQVTLSAPTAGASASSPGDSLNFVFSSPAAAPGNPNPAAGLIVVNLQDNYSTYVNGFSSFISPISGSAISSGLTAGNAYTIAALGSSTQAQFVTAGLQSTVTAAVGVSFIAAATSISGGGTCYATQSAGIDHIEVVGNPNLMNSNGAYLTGASTGMEIILACYKNTALTAPTVGTQIFLNFHLNDSAQGV